MHNHIFKLGKSTCYIIFFWFLCYSGRRGIGTNIVLGFGVKRVTLLLDIKREHSSNQLQEQTSMAFALS